MNKFLSSIKTFKNDVSNTQLKGDLFNLEQLLHQVVSYKSEKKEKEEEYLSSYTLLLKQQLTLIQSTLALQNSLNNFNPSLLPNTQNLLVYLLNQSKQLKSYTVDLQSSTSSIMSDINKIITTYNTLSAKNEETLKKNNKKLADLKEEQKRTEKTVFSSEKFKTDERYKEMVNKLQSVQTELQEIFSKIHQNQIQGGELNQQKDKLQNEVQQLTKAIDERDNLIKENEQNYESLKKSLQEIRDKQRQECVKLDERLNQMNSSISTQLYKQTIPYTLIYDKISEGQQVEQAMILQLQKITSSNLLYLQQFQSMDRFNFTISLQFCPKVYLKTLNTAIQQSLQNLWCQRDHQQTALILLLDSNMFQRTPFQTQLPLIEDIIKTLSKHNSSIKLIIYDKGQSKDSFFTQFNQYLTTKRIDTEYISNLAKLQNYLPQLLLQKQKRIDNIKQRSIESVNSNIDELLQKNIEFFEMSIQNLKEEKKNNLYHKSQLQEALYQNEFKNREQKQEGELLESKKGEAEEQEKLLSLSISDFQNNFKKQSLQKELAPLLEQENILMRQNEELNEVSQFIKEYLPFLKFKIRNIIKEFLTSLQNLIKDLDLEMVQISSLISILFKKSDAFSVLFSIISQDLKNNLDESLEANLKNILGIDELSAKTLMEQISINILNKETKNRSVEFKFLFEKNISHTNQSLLDKLNLLITPQVLQTINQMTFYKGMEEYKSALSEQLQNLSQLSN